MNTETEYPAGKYRFTLGIGYASRRECEMNVPEDLGFDHKEWGAMSDKEKEEELDQEWQNFANNYIESGYSLINDG